MKWISTGAPSKQKYWLNARKHPSVILYKDKKKKHYQSVRSFSHKDLYPTITSVTLHHNQISSSTCTWTLTRFITSTRCVSLLHPVVKQKPQHFTTLLILSTFIILACWVKHGSTSPLHTMRSSFIVCGVHHALLSPGVWKHSIWILIAFYTQTLKAAVKGYKIYLALIA